MAAGAATEEALKSYVILHKVARGEIFPAGRRGIKASTATEYAESLFDDYGIDVHAEGFETELPDWFLEAAHERLAATFEEDYWQDINDTTRDNIQNILEDGIEDGLSTRDIAKMIEDVAPDRAGWRAMNCARTEIGNAMNSGHEASIRDLGDDTGLDVKKEWLSVCGSTTRPDHCALDGVSVAVDDTFDLGGNEARWPGDELLPPEERCNCQCTLISNIASDEIANDEQPDYLTEFGQFGGEAGWNPDDHPRDEGGRFSSGGGGSTADDDSPDTHEDYSGDLSDKQLKQTKSANFKNWFGDWENDPENASKIVDSAGKPQKSFNYSKAVDENGEPLVVFHGTTHDFTEFKYDKANPENHLGRGFYFTESKDDADRNYAGEGPDLTSRIHSLQDQLRDTETVNGIEDILRDAREAGESINDHKDEIMELLEQDSLIPEPGAAYELIRATYEAIVRDGDANESVDVANNIARSQLSGGEPKIIPAFLNIRNPVVLGNPNDKQRRPEETRYELRSEERDANGRSPDDDDFDPDTAEFTGNLSGSGNDIREAVRLAAADGDYHELDWAQVQSDLDQAFANYDGELTAEQVRQTISRSEGAIYMTDDSGALAAGDFVAAVFKQFGHDGVIYLDASKHFANMGISPGTRHFIAWEPTQVKSAVKNSGKFDPNNPDFTKDWHEEDHPRDDHGRFGSGSDQPREDLPGQEHFAFDKDNIRLPEPVFDPDKPREYQDNPNAPLEYRSRVAAVRAEYVVAKGIENGVEVSLAPQSFDSMSDSEKEKAQVSWEQDHYDEYAEPVEDEWKKEVEQEAEDEAKSEIENDAVAGEWLADQLEELGYDRDSVMESITSVNDRGINLVPETLRWSDPESHDSDKLGPGEVYSRDREDDIDAQWREEFESRLESRQAELIEEKTADGLPEDKRQQVYENLSNAFSELSDSDKMEVAGATSEIVPLAEPDSYEVTDNEADGYKETSGIARYVQEKIGDEELERRGVAGADSIDMADVAKDMWDEWKGSSTSSKGLLIQYATAKELGGLSQHFSSSQMRDIQTAAMQLSKDNSRGADGPTGAERIQWHIDRGMAIAQAHIHGTWAASQYVLKKSGIDQLPVYRGLKFDSEKLDKEKIETVRAGGTEYEKIPNIVIKRNGAASTSANKQIANDWGNSGTRVVLRVQAPASAILSLPVFGQNLHNEEEVVLAGTQNWAAWDAWRGRAPSDSALTIKGFGCIIKP